MKIFQNAIQCPDGTILLSNNNYEVKKHSDLNGKEYAIAGGKNCLERLSANDYKELSITEHHSIQFAMENLLWFSNNRYNMLKDLESGHLEAVYNSKSSTLFHKFVAAEILTLRKYWPRRLNQLRGER